MNFDINGRGPMGDALESLTNAFVAMMIWEKLGRMGGEEVGQVLRSDIAEAFELLADEVDDFAVAEEGRGACFISARRWMQRNQAAIAAGMSRGDEGRATA